MYYCVVKYVLTSPQYHWPLHPLVSSRACHHQLPTFTTLLLLGWTRNRLAVSVGLETGRRDVRRLLQQLLQLLLQPKARASKRSIPTQVK